MLNYSKKYFGDIIHLVGGQIVKGLFLDGSSIIPKELIPDEDAVIELAGEMPFSHGWHRRYRRTKKFSFMNLYEHQF